MKYFGCPESYADPVRQYGFCKERGRTQVTLTDHDSIAGGLRLLDLPDFLAPASPVGEAPGMRRAHVGLSYEMDC